MSLFKHAPVEEGLGPGKDGVEEKVGQPTWVVALKQHHHSVKNQFHVLLGPSLRREGHSRGSCPPSRRPHL